MTLTMLAASETAAPSSFATVMDHVAQGFEVLGALILVVGVLWSFALAVLAWRQPGQAEAGLHGAAPGVWRHPAARPGDPGCG